MSLHKYQIIPMVTKSSAYSAGDVVGSSESVGIAGRLFMPGIISASYDGYLVAAGMNFSSTTQSSDFVVTLYHEQPSGTYVDHGAPTPDADDYSKILNVLTFKATDNYTYNELNIPLVGLCQDLYAVITCSGTPTFTTERDLIISMIMEW